MFITEPTDQEVFDVQEAFVQPQGWPDEEEPKRSEIKGEDQIKKCRTNLFCCCCNVGSTANRGPGQGRVGQTSQGFAGGEAVSAAVTLNVQNKSFRSFKPSTIDELSHIIKYGQAWQDGPARTLYLYSTIGTNIL